ncbi:Hypothetical predicted protein [Cloeon dipterum]|uniref:Uncharacterized protein n=1 Tax=Cloeon dipterum TaxID=197152 RepID=A0A8S1CYM4_9INSE|nr:Hypothetical predicted protein [Cloeon dipterum]
MLYLFSYFRAMETDRELRVAKIRLQNLKRVTTSLETLALQIIVNNIKHFRGKEDLKRLKGSFRQKLLHEFTNVKRAINTDRDSDEFEDVLRSFKLLLFPDTEEIRLNGLLTFCPVDLIEQQLTNVIELILNRAPNIQSLVLNEAFEEITNFPCTKIISRHQIERIKNLVNLTHLKIDLYAVHLTELMTMCRKLENLKHLDVNIYFDVDLASLDSELFIKDLKNSFSHLSVFLFKDLYLSTPILRELNEFRLAKLCYKHLPNIQVVQSFASRNRSNDFLERERQILSFVECQRTETSALQHFSTMGPNIDCGTHEFSAGLFPEVKHLKVTWLNPHQGDVTPLLQFTKIETLTIKHSPSQRKFDLFLNQYGKNLSELNVLGEKVWNDHHLKSQFSKIFRFCPKLERLSLVGIDILDHSRNICFFSNLRELEWTPTEYSKARLSKILMAPKLETLYLNVSDESFVFDLYDLNLVSNMITKKQILDQITRFEVRFFCRFPFREDRMINDNFTAWSDLLKNAAAYLPKLADLKVKFLINPLKNYKTPDLLIRSIESVFDSHRGCGLFDFVDASITII